MSIDTEHMRKFIIRPTLQKIGMWSQAAENLLLGTAAQESHLGTYLKQVGGGPALGIYQMEPNTYYDIWTNYILRKGKIEAVMASVCSSYDSDNLLQVGRLISDLQYATIMTRLHYYRVAEKLPDEDDIDGLAQYWKTYYNTKLGKGTIEEFNRNYMFYVDHKGK